MDLPVANEGVKQAPLQLDTLYSIQHKPKMPNACDRRSMETPKCRSNNLAHHPAQSISARRLPFFGLT
jgi:hypothetical protein